MSLERRLSVSVDPAKKVIHLGRERMLAKADEPHPCGWRHFFFRAVGGSCPGGQVQPSLANGARNEQPVKIQQCTAVSDWNISCTALSRYWKSDPWERSRDAHRRAKLPPQCRWVLTLL